MPTWVIVLQKILEEILPNFSPSGLDPIGSLDNVLTWYVSQLQFLRVWVARYSHSGALAALWAFIINVKSHTQALGSAAENNHH